MKTLRSLLIVILFCLLAVPSYAAISAATIWETRTAGADTNGGGFVATGTDMSIFDNKNAAGCSSCQSATVNISTTDGVTAGTTTITSATGNYSSALIGNIVHIQGGTGSVASGWYQVITVPGATSFTVDRSTGLTAGTGVSVDIGGALLSPSIAASIAIAGNTVYIKAGVSAYSVTSASSATAGGVISSTSQVLWIGYSTTRTVLNTDTRPIIQVNVATTTLVAATSGIGIFVNLAFDGNSQTAARFSSGAFFYRAKISGFNTASTGVSSCDFCEATSNSASVFSTSGVVSNSEIHGNTATQLGATLLNSLVYSNSGATTDGFAAGTAIGSVFYANGRDGLVTSANFSGVWKNNVAEGNTRYGFNPSQSTKLLENNFTYNNNGGTGTTQILLTATNPIVNVGAVNITVGSPFTSAATGDFSLNALVNRGALVRAAGFPATYPLGVTTSFLDAGAAQHQDSGSSTVTIGIPIGQ